MKLQYIYISRLSENKYSVKAYINLFIFYVRAMQ